MVAGAAETRAEEIAQRIADILIEGFDRHYRLFRESSADAKQRFEIAAWTEAQQAVKERIRFYDDRVRECVERLHDELDAGALDDATWRRAKLYYIGLLVDHRRPELAETFFNSVVTRVLQRTYVHNDFAFVRAAISTEYIESDPPIYRSYYPAETGLRQALLEIFADFGWSRPFADLERDVGFVWQALLEHFGGEWPAREPNYQVQVLGSAFYRNKAAYVIGKIVNGNAETPFAIPVLHDADGTARARHGAARLGEPLRPLLPLAGVLHGRHGRALRVRAVPADADAGEAALGPVHGGRPREAGEDALLPRPAAPPAPLTGRRSSRRPARVAS